MLKLHEARQGAHQIETLTVVEAELVNGAGTKGAIVGAAVGFATTGTVNGAKQGAAIGSAIEDAVMDFFGL